MSRIIAFFEAAEKEFKVLEADAAGVFIKLFGTEALAQLETTADNILESDLGQAVLADAETLLAQVKAGQISQHAAIVSLSATIITAAKIAGIKLESSIGTAVAALAIDTLSGALKPPNAQPMAPPARPVPPPVPETSPAVAPAPPAPRAKPEPPAAKK